jgi:hypothetical protein
MSGPLPGQLGFWEAPRTGRTGEDTRHEMLASFSRSEREGAARDKGMDLAAAAQELSNPGWHDRADAALRRLAERTPAVFVDDLYLDMGLVDEDFNPVAGADWPSHANAWASVWQRAIRDEVLAKEPVSYQPTRLPGKHRHIYPVRRSLVYRQKESAA